MSEPSLDALLVRFFNGDRAALARLLSVVENNSTLAPRVISAIYERTGGAQIIGITGPPGGGKSTLVNALIGAYRASGRTVGVLAVDPSSSFSGGATLGDRIRMLERWNDPGVYIRSLATRGQLGGLSAAVHDATHVLDAFGFDVILVETVGVGQAEVDVSRVAQTVILLQVPGLGDSVQTIKAGVLEIADILAVNKADIPGADALVIDLRHMLRLAAHADWSPPIVQVVSTTGEGIETIIQRVNDHQAYLRESGTGDLRAAQRARDDVLQGARRRLDRQLAVTVRDSELDDLVQAVAQRRMPPADAVELVMQRLRHTQPQVT